MAVKNLANTNATGLNLFTGATVDTYTTTADGWVCGTLYISGLNAAASTLTVKVVILDASDVQLGVPVSYSMAKDAAANTTAKREWGPVRVRSGEKVRVTLFSTNSSDTTNPAARSIIDDAYAADVTLIGGNAATSSGTVNFTTGNTLASGTSSHMLNVSGGVAQADMVKLNSDSTAAACLGYFVLGTGHINGVRLSAEQLKLSIDDGVEPAFSIVNSNAFGLGMYIYGGNTGQYIFGDNIGQYIIGDNIGQYIGGDIGQYIIGDSRAARYAASGTNNAFQIGIGEINTVWNTTTPPTASQNADAVWDEARSGHTTNGTYGAVSEWAGANSLTAADVWTYATRTITAYNWGGTGAYAITVNVKEGVTNMSGASVSFTQGSDVYTATTNASGNASFSLDAGAFTLAIWKAGYSFTPESVTVTGAATLNKTITTVNAPSASDPGQCIIYHTARERTGAIKSGVVFSIQAIGGDDAVVDGMGTTTINSAETTATSSGTSENNVSFTLARGTKAKIKRGTGAYRGFTVPNSGSAQLVDCLTETVTGIDV